MTFTIEARAKAETIWLECQHHPFIKKLQNGSLEMDIFRYYLIQDYHYLIVFNEILLHAAELTNEAANKKLFLDNAEGLKNTEIAFRKNFFKESMITENEVKQVPIAPATYHYITHLSSVVHSGQLKRVVAALLPCYWLYREIGIELKQTKIANPFYQCFIDTYTSEEYNKCVDRQIIITDELAEKATTLEYEQMLTDFLISSYEERAFWEMAYKKESWK
ncbi:thiaminase II [Melissococcus plutonius]|uniref:Aminopyrimidine aminohydrolase n=1 Tax=Melissococcus plutonius TaxID=33970 RepID=A0A2Z5Y2H6_9ENTE|nr:thiaminase II [Melissococcus plutonius]BAL62198.1 thiaminase II [Melissococcus plutonius DAT561]MCV2497969.1 thiaminase II [Melissococcus plutonius]MCV2500773.1 thiaminase II [Melissococcus plutonius]MCV2505310.1 thiaminase II [Melissococcus plutonius]MCV2506584.1 thiaminase II [Melissococcus plutonius]